MSCGYSLPDTLKYLCREDQNYAPADTHLARFLRLAHELLLTPEQQAKCEHALEELIAYGLPKADNEVLLNLAWQWLVEKCGWTLLHHFPQPFYILTSPDGLLRAYLHPDEMKIFEHPDHPLPRWYGEFVLCAPYPENKQDRIAAIEANEDNLLGGFDEDWVNIVLDNYQLRYPGLPYATISMSRGTMTRWRYALADKRHPDFTRFVTIFEREFDRLVAQRYLSMLPERFLYQTSNPYWQWSKLPMAELKERLGTLVLTATSEEEIRRVLLGELGYPNDEECPCLYIFAHSDSTVTSGFSIQLADPDDPAKWLCVNDPEGAHS